MATSLYDLSVPTFLQTVRAVAGFLQRAAKHCAETGADPDDLVHARLIADMAPFHFQIEALSHHSVWGLQAVKTGVFAPPALVGAMPFGGLRAMVDDRQRRWRRSRPPRSTAGPARRWTLPSTARSTKTIAPRPGRRDNSLSRRRLSSFPFRCPTSISTPSPPMTSCVRGVCRLASATTRDGCALGRPRPNRTLRQTAKIDIDGREARSCLRGRRVAASGWWFDNRGLLSTTACLSTKVTAQSPRPRPRGHRSAV
jgi:hypothetical protein